MLLLSVTYTCNHGTSLRTRADRTVFSPSPRHRCPLFCLEFISEDIVWHYLLTPVRQLWAKRRPLLLKKFFFYFWHSSLYLLFIYLFKYLFGCGVSLFGGEACILKYWLIYFSLCWVSLWHMGFLQLVHWLSCLRACGISVPRLGLEPLTLTLAGRFLIHWATREVLSGVF